ncbi:MAG: trypsin-like peptidase domain-containing protein [Deltaproteobacteria bacterium]|nr:trypsin-like peptidase domain-containing protein [Deltaproteobacteria bacterium]
MLLLALALATAPVLWTESDAKLKPLFTAPSVAPLVEKMEPAVLVVFTEGQGPAELAGRMPEMPEGMMPPDHPGLPPMGPMGPLGPEEGDEGLMRGQGAGFLITKDGYALTNHHVVEGATHITVFVGDDRTELDATVIGSDEKTDVALIKITSDRKDWPVIPLADSDKVRVGDYVVAIGSPFGLEQSVSLGIVSARGRRDIAPSGRQGLYDFIQTDASINPGNSGGPLLDVYGSVIGINSAVNAAGSGIGFAIPINMVKKMLPSLQKSGRYERSWIGVSIQPVDKDVAAGLGLPSTRGALVREVVVGGPAEKAGVLPGDVITQFDGRAVREANELPLLAGDAGVDATVALALVREKKPMSLKLTLGSHPDNARAGKKLEAPSAELPKKAVDPSIGISVLSLDGDDRVRLELPKDLKGARVTKVRPGSVAFFAGVSPDDVITTINGKTVTSGEEFAALVRATPSGELLKLMLRRGPSTIFAVMKKP